MRLSAFILTLLLPLAGLPALAASSTANAPHVHVELLAPGSTLHRGSAGNDAGIYFRLEPGWHIYWKNAGDAGEPPRVRWALPRGITAGPMLFPAPRRLPLGTLMDFGYENEVLFPLKLRVSERAPSGPASLRATVNWLVCQSSCIPGSAALEVQRQVDTISPALSYKPDPLFQRFLARLPRPIFPRAHPVFQATNEGFRLAVTTGQRENAAIFFPNEPLILNNAAAQQLTPTPKGFILDLKKDDGLNAPPARLSGVLELSGERFFALTALPGDVPAPSRQALSFAATTQKTPLPALPAAQNFLWSALLRAAGLAFLGGVLLNLMPCVFPVLFLKGLALARSGQQELRQLRRSGVVYAAGILLSFWTLVAALLGLRAAGATLGWGFQFQSPLFLALMADLLFFLGLSLAGLFEIGLTLTSAGGSLATRQGYAGSFFTGVLAVVVATPCTAPFMGTAIGYALAQPAAVSFAVFTALALGLAAPYLALALQPAWTALLPRPGAWMKVAQQVVSLPLFATAIWLVWVLARAYGAAILPALLAGFLLLVLAGWLLGRGPGKKWPALLASLFLVAVVLLDVYGQQRAAADAGGQSKTPSAASDAAATGNWEAWSAAAADRYRAQGRPVFVDFTASWCLSCQVNERAALRQPQIMQAFQERHVALLRADWTRHDAAITQALAQLGRSGVPTYVLYVPGEKSPRMLPELLTPGIVTDALNNLAAGH